MTLSLYFFFPTEIKNDSCPLHFQHIIFFDFQIPTEQERQKTKVWSISWKWNLWGNSSSHCRISFFPWERLAEGKKRTRSIGVRRSSLSCLRPLEWWCMYLLIAEWMTFFFITIPKMVSLRWGGGNPRSPLRDVEKHILISGRVDV